MFSNRRRLLSALPLLFVAACAADADPGTPATASGVATVEQAAVYGNDDRLDYYAVTDQRLQALTDGAIVAMMNSSDVDVASSGVVSLNGDTFGPTYNLCTDERFYDQINAADCSATLIDDDLVLTAGHCVTSSTECRRQQWVFRYYMESEADLATITEEDVFGCAELVVQDVSSSRTEELDYAILRLDRPATPRFTPAPVAINPQLTEGTPVVIIGFGSGLPAKIDAGGAVVDPRSSTRDYFEATTDSFGGNSGSGVFNDQGEVIGILVRGQNDYEWSGRCMRPAEYSNSGTGYGAEGITYAERAIEALCATGYQSERLCNTSVVCGDGICAGGESTSCPDDCGSGIPGWDCDASFYGTGDGCDCECGAVRDPDCDDPNQQVINCEAGEICNDAGLCEPDGGSVEPDPVGPDGWTCDPAVYDAGDGCDCECGIFDPDCADAGAQLFNCEAGQTCSADAICIDLDGTDPVDEGTGDGTGEATDDGFGEILFGAGGSSGCAAAGPGSAPGFALLGLVGLIARRRRYSGSAATKA